MTRERPKRRGSIGLAILVMLVSVLLPQPAAPASATTDWATWGFDAQRTGYNPFETTLSPSIVPNLTLGWTANLGAVIDMSPAYATGVDVNGTPTDLVYVGTEHGDFYALNANTGAVVWQLNLGSADSGCTMTPDQIFGVTGTPALDPSNNTLYVVGATDLFALDMSNGTVGWHVPLLSDPVHEHVWGGVNLWNGKVYAGIASYCDHGPYFGRVTAVDTATHAVSATWYAIDPPGSFSGGGVWGWGGVSVDPATGDVYAATGNSKGKTTQHLGYAEQVVRLTAGLVLVSNNYPGLTGTDVDFGSTPVLFQAPGCVPQLVVENKEGSVFLYNRDSISSGPVQRIQIANGGGPPLIGVAAYSPVTNTVYVSSGADSSDLTYQHGLLAFNVQADCTLALAWHGRIGPNGSTYSPPVVANGVVYVGDGRHDHLYALNASTGKRLWQSRSTITGALFAQPTVVNGKVFAGAWDDTIYMFKT